MYMCVSGVNRKNAMLKLLNVIYNEYVSLRMTIDDFESMKSVP